MKRLYDALDAFSSCTGIPVTIYAEESQSFKISPEQLEALSSAGTQVMIL